MYDDCNDNSDEFGCGKVGCGSSLGGLSLHGAVMGGHHYMVR